MVIGILVLAAYTNKTGFWITAIIIDLAIIYIGIQSITTLRKPKFISSPIGRTLEYTEISPEENPEGKKND